MYDLKLKPIEDVNNTIEREKAFEQAVLEATKAIFDNKIPKFDYDGEEMFRSDYEMKKIRNKVFEERKNDRSLKYFERQMNKAKTVKRKETGFESISQNVNDTKTIDMAKYRDNAKKPLSDRNGNKESVIERKQQNKRLRQMSKKLSNPSRFDKKAPIDSESNSNSTTRSDKKPQNDVKIKHDKYSKSDTRHDNKNSSTKLRKHTGGSKEAQERSDRKGKFHKHDGTEIKRMKFRNSSNRASNDAGSNESDRQQELNQRIRRKDQNDSHGRDRPKGKFSSLKSFDKNNDQLRDFSKSPNFRKPSMLGRNSANRKVFKDNYAKFQKKSTNRPGKARRAENRERIKQQVTKA